MVETIATTTAPGTPAPEHEATALGFGAGGWVAWAMFVVFGIALIAKVPSIVARMLDSKIAGIREQLDTAAQLRREAEALKADYEAKARDAHREVEEMRAGAARQAEEIVAKAQADATALIARHGAMAEEKIAAAERAMLAEIRATAADAATNAARALIAEKHGAGADQALVDQAIGGLGRLN